MNNINVDDLPTALKHELENTLLASLGNSPIDSSLPIKQRIARLAFLEFSNKLARGELTDLDDKEEAKSLLTLAVANDEGSFFLTLNKTYSFLSGCDELCGEIVD